MTSSGDLFTREAAVLAGVSEAVFRTRAKKLGLVPGKWNRCDLLWTQEQVEAVRAYKPQRAQNVTEKKGGKA